VLCVLEGIKINILGMVFAKEWFLLREYLDKEISFLKHKAKSTAPEKQSVVSQKQSVVYTSLQI